LSSSCFPFSTPAPTLTRLRLARPAKLRPACRAPSVARYRRCATLQVPSPSEGSTGSELRTPEHQIRSQKTQTSQAVPEQRKIAKRSRSSGPKTSTFELFRRPSMRILCSSRYSVPVSALPNGLRPFPVARRTSHRGSHPLSAETAGASCLQDFQIRL